MTELEQNLTRIKNEKDTKLLPENIKEGVQIFDVIGTFRGGTDTSDATATSYDLIFPKTAYVKGEKITGSINATTGIWAEGQNSISVRGHMHREESDIQQEIVEGILVTNRIPISSTNTYLLPSTQEVTSTYNILVNGPTVASAVGLTPEKLMSGNNVLGIVGTGGAAEEQLILEALQNINGAHD